MEKNPPNTFAPVASERLIKKNNNRSCGERFNVVLRRFLFCCNLPPLPQLFALHHFYSLNCNNSNKKGRLQKLQKYFQFAVEKYKFDDIISLTNFKGEIT